VIAVQDGGQAAAAPVTPARAAAVTAGALRVLSISPANGRQGVNGTGTVTVTYNEPLPASASLPKLSPAIAGSWRRTGDTAVFTPARGFSQDTRVTVTAAGSGKGRSKASFTTGRYRTVRLQQVLAQLGYLPVTWTPAKGALSLGGTARAQLSAAYTPPAGKFAWKAGYPSELRSFWDQGKSNTLDRGALTAFESVHGLPLATDGTVSPAAWKALLTAAAKRQKNTRGYSYAIASKAEPETLTIWRGGKKVFSSRANTGIPAAPTVDGTFPVYEKLTSQVMTGTNPDGTPYSDLVYWVSYFNGGDAVHYFDRGYYGYPQSLGCVELPYTAAKDAYPYLPYGTLVTVTG
jgi:L,D-transpeptidase catalytic domain/Bacterial Ig-like domain